MLVVITFSHNTIPFLVLLSIYTKKNGALWGIRTPDDRILEIPALATELTKHYILNYVFVILLIKIQAYRFNAER